MFTFIWPHVLGTSPFSSFPESQWPVQQGQPTVGGAANQIRLQTSQNRSVLLDVGTIYWVSDGETFPAYNHFCKEWTSITSVEGIALEAVCLCETQPPCGGWCETLLSNGVLFLRSATFYLWASKIACSKTNKHGSINFHCEKLVSSRIASNLEEMKL